MKVRLLVWMVALAAAAALLLGGASWPGTTDPAVAVMAVVRMVAGLLAAWLLAATLVSIVAAVHWQRAIGPAIVRRVVAAAIGGGLLVTPLAASATSAPTPAADAPVLRRAPDATTTTASTPASTPAPAEPSTATVTVAAGDHLWAIAERTVAARLGRDATDAEVAPYWRRLIEVNRDRLATGDPDLIFAGQVFRLPS